MKPILLLLFAATAACVGALLPLISRARSKRLLLNAVRRASSDAPDGIGIYPGRLNGENVMAVSVAFNSANENLAATRYVVSLERVDGQIHFLTAVVGLICLAIILFVVFSSSYFINSIVNPVSEIGSTARKIAHQEQELEATQDRERLRELGDILTSNLHQMHRGMGCLRTADFYDPEGAEVDIRLDPLLTPQQNATKYYKEYNKAKTAQEMLTQQLEKGRRELDYLNSVLENITLAEGEKDLGEIRQELTDTGYLRRASKAKGREKRVSSKPMEFRSTAGLRISVGKNNTQNDLLTCKQAFKSDIWFHTQKIHGSHVILWTEGGTPDLQSLNEAACLAAWFSQARDSSKVPVDYTPVKYVKKPNGARPGMVTYTTYETAWVTPDGELAKRLRVK